MILEDREGANTGVNPPQQARSRRTLERIVRAALEILEDGGPDALTVQRVVSRAGSSVGSFYARFGGKDDLLEYLGARVWDEARARWDDTLAAGAWDGLDLEGLSERAVRLLVDARGRQTAHMKALDAMAGSRGDGYERFHARVLEGLARLFLAREDEIVHPDPELAVRLGLAAVSGIVGARDPATSGSYEPDVLRREGRLLLAAYLGRARDAEGATDLDYPPGHEPEEDVDFFDVWG